MVDRHGPANEVTESREEVGRGERSAPIEVRGIAAQVREQEAVR